MDVPYLIQDWSDMVRSGLVWSGLLRHVERIHVTMELQGLQETRPKRRVEAGALPPHPVFVGLWASPGLRLMIAVGKYYY